MELFTIGHSNLNIEAFISLLQKHGITAVADVRSHPYSRYLPHFNKSELEAALKDAKIEYRFLGQELGARPNDPSCYNGAYGGFRRMALELHQARPNAASPGNRKSFAIGLIILSALLELKAIFLNG